MDMKKSVRLLGAAALAVSMSIANPGVAQAAGKDTGMAGLVNNLCKSLADDGAVSNIGKCVTYTHQSITNYCANYEKLGYANAGACKREAMERIRNSSY